MGARSLERGEVARIERDVMGERENQSLPVIGENAKTLFLDGDNVTARDMSYRRVHTLCLACDNTKTVWHG